MEISHLKGKAKLRGDGRTVTAHRIDSGTSQIYDAAILGGHAHEKRALLDSSIRACLDSAEQTALRMGMDAGEAIFSRMLTEQTLGVLFRHEYAPAKWLNEGFISIDTSLHPGTEEYGYEEITDVGEARIVSPDADDVPTVNIKGERTVQIVKTIAAGFLYSRQEARKAQLQGSFNLVQEKGRVAREAIDRLLNRLIPFGDAAQGLIGLLRAPGILVRTAANGPWTAGSDPLDVLSDFSAAVTDMITGSGGVEVPNTAVFPLATLRMLETLPFSTLDGTPVLDLIQRYHPFITTWEWDTQMDTAGFDGGPAIAIFSDDPSKVRGIMPMGMTPIPEQEQGFITKVGIELRWGGIIAPRPRSVLLLQGV